MSAMIDEPSISQVSPSAWHTLPIEDVFQNLEADAHLGLTPTEVAVRRQEYGWNELSEAPPVPAWKKLLGQFQDPIVWILIIAAVISGALAEWADTIAILVIVLVNGVLAFLQEERAGQALAALRKISTPTAKVIRDGVVSVVPARELVPGDCIELEAGDHIPADGRLLKSFRLRVQESALTGESIPVDKEPDDDVAPNAPLGDRRNMVYLGTAVSAGKAAAVIVATGMNTELGQIAGLMERSLPELTPLQRRLEELGKVLATACIVIAALIFILQLARGRPLWDTLLISVSLAVAAVPEGLPAVVTLALALGLQRMVKRRVLVRKLPSVETLGSVTVICSDKTGTLTRNEMTVREIVTANARYRLTGAGYAPHGEIHKSAENPAETIRVDTANEPDLRQLLTIAARCSHAAVHSPEENGVWKVVGDPTEGALVVAARKAGLSFEDPADSLIHEIPFDSDRKAMSVIVRTDDERILMYTKGAPEAILRNCRAEYRGGRLIPLAPERRAELMQMNAAMAGRALRVLGFAFREHLPDEDANYEETDLVFVGLAGMIDPPRDEVRDAVLTCRAAGIRPVMITGDHPETAQAIAHDLQLIGDTGRVLTGPELDVLSDEELASQVDQFSVYARVSPEHKLRVVRAWKQQGQIVAMTGDGVNDAPAVDAADVGVAMGITGTDVTKQASDMVLTDDNFTSIIAAVEEGRTVFENIQKFVHYLLACNAGEVLLMFFAALVGWPVPLLAVQILWINLVTDGLPALALSLEPPEADIMSRPPRPPRRPVITLHEGLLMLAHGALIAAVAAAGFWWTYQGDPQQLGRAQMTAFYITAFSQLFFALGCRSQRFTIFQIGLLTNPYLIGALVISALLQLSVIVFPFTQSVFGAGEQLTWEWLLIVFLSLTPVTIIELLKLGRFRGQ